jgi:uncharacterized Fe-S cluster protein YjdI
MAESEVVKTYSNSDITVIWKPRRCIHSGICVKMLPQVYDPDSRPWIKPEHATASDLMRQIEQCPSGALSYTSKTEKINNDTKSIEKEEVMISIRVEIISNGPLLLHGRSEVVFPDGRSELKHRTTAFCRCGASGTKPYCDGSHNDTDFEG